VPVAGAAFHHRREPSNKFGYYAAGYPSNCRLAWRSQQPDIAIAIALLIIAVLVAGVPLAILCGDGGLRTRQSRTTRSRDGVALLILNRASGTGHVAEFVETLGNALRAGHGAALEVETMVVDNHPDARSATSEYARFASRPALVACVDRRRRAVPLTRNKDWCVIVPL